jgi:imidazolonepropionase-like amidohydrolase
MRADAHVHLSYGEAADLDSLVAHGVTAVRDCGGNLAQLLQWRAEIAAGTRRGPRLYIAGPVLDGPKEGAEYRLTVRTANDAERAVDSLANAGVDFLKTHSGISPEAFFALLRHARTRGLKVAAHLPRGIPAWVAVDSGVGSLEHAAESILASPIYAGLATDVAGAMAWWRSPAGDSALRRMARLGVTVVPTLVRYEATIDLAVTPELRAARRAVMPDLLDLVGRLHRAGVPLLAGSDLVGIPDGPKPWNGPEREIELLVNAGLSPAAARETASHRALEKWFAARR